MKKINKPFVLILALLIIIFPSVLLSTGCLDPFTYLYMSMENRPDPPLPEITSAEFPFKLVYIIDGEEVVYEDVITCTYNGIIIEDGRPDKYRTWINSYGKASYTVLRELDNEQAVIFNINYSAAYLMGDTESRNYYGDPPEVILASPYKRHNGETAYLFDKVIEAQELKDVYGIEIISFEMPPPIENTFLSEDTANDSEE